MKKLIVASLVALLAAFASPIAANAHDDVVSTYPSSGETVEAGLVGIQVSFSGDVMASETNEGFEIRVSDSGGNEQPVGCLSAAGTMLSSTASLATAGDYKVDWRSVGSDGHPLEGSFKFTLTNSSNYEQQSADQIPCAVAYDAEMPVTTAEVAKTESTDNSGLLGLAIGAGFIVIGTVTGALAVRIRERNERKKPKKLYED
jgi:methionine-rich copper-binding protein CopC